MRRLAQEIRSPQQPCQLDEEPKHQQRQQQLQRPAVHHPEQAEAAKEAAQPAPGGGRGRQPAFGRAGLAVELSRRLGQQPGQRQQQHQEHTQRQQEPGRAGGAPEAARRGLPGLGAGRALRAFKPLRICRRCAGRAGAVVVVFHALHHRLFCLAGPTTPSQLRTSRPRFCKGARRTVHSGSDSRNVLP